MTKNHIVLVALLFGLLFVGLKLGGPLTWPWHWVLSPFWIPPAAVISVVFLPKLFMGVVGALARR